MHVTLLVASALLGLASSVSYEGYKVYKVFAETAEEMELLAKLENEENLDFWSKLNRLGHPVSVMASPNYQDTFIRYLNANNISHTLEIPDVEVTIQAEKLAHKAKPKLAHGRVAYDRFIRANEINEFVLQVAQDNPDIVRSVNIGKSYEGRDLLLLHITSGSGPKPVIFVDAGIHAREWIAPSVAVYLIEELIKPANRALITEVEWVIWPLVNPDGYDFSWADTRLWRKTRTPGTLCIGVDGNRNFDFHWMETGASSSQCSETYAGPVAFSEPETAALRDYVLSLSDVKLYLTLHSYGQYLLYPWGYGSELPDNWRELDDLGNLVNNAIGRLSGTTYTVGSSTNVLYAAAGASDDWAMGIAGIDLVYTIELPGGGWYGFDLPAARIVDVVQETFEGFVVYHDYVVQKYKRTV